MEKAGRGGRWALRCFVALELDEEAKKFLGNAAREIEALGLHASMVPAENMHVTLCFLGEIPKAQAREKASALSALSFPPFPCKVKNLGVFPNESFVRVAWAGVESEGKIEELHGKVHALVAKGTQAEKEREKFHAHATLARIKSPQNAGKLLQWAQKKNAEGFLHECTATRVVLKQTVFTPDGKVEYVDVL